jgi:hypothetical protein
MAQIVRTTNDIIVNSLYLLGELGVGEAPDNFMLSTGLELINEILDQFDSDSIYVPFLKTINFFFIPGKDTYSFSTQIPADINTDRIVDLSFANYRVPAGHVYPYPIPISFTYTADSVTSTLTMDSTAAFPTGTPVFVTSTGSVPSPLFPGETYYAINLSPTTLSLAINAPNALEGIFIQLLSDGTGSQIITTSVQPQVGTNESIIYPLMIINKATYYGVVRLQNLIARPGFIFLNKQSNVSYITVYPAPDQPYLCTLQAKVMIDSLEADQDISELPPFYYSFLKYALARKFLAYYPSGNWPQTNEDEYQRVFNDLKNANETDLTIRPSVVLNSPQPFYWPNILAY